MKTKILIVFILCTCLKVNGQQTGIFLTWQDYQNNKIIQADKIVLNHLLSGKCVNIQKNERDTSLCKDSIFGYRDETGKTYRFYKEYDDEYEILESRYMVIYVVYKPTYTSKGLAAPLRPVYFFSKSLNSEIMRLTIPNLTNAWPDNHKFHHALDDEFGNGTSVSQYDDKHNMFRVNYILGESFQ